MISFTPVESSLGGILIGLSAAGTLLVHGRIAGISGMVHGLRDWSNVEDVKFRLMFLLGLVGGASLLAGAPGAVLLAGGASPVTVALGLPLWRYAVAGLLVGAGTKVGHGCTSGHGVCGLGRLSVRSIVNVIGFLVAGILLASFTFASGELLGVAPTTVPGDGGEFAWQTVLVFVLPLIAIALAVKFNQPRASHLTLGAMFGFGLAISGMTEPTKVIGFLNVRSGHWDPSLRCAILRRQVLGRCGAGAQGCVRKHPNGAAIFREESISRERGDQSGGVGEGRRPSSDPASLPGHVFGRVGHCLSVVVCGGECAQGGSV
jgi:uncharacterized membrane protein YedE/YeeE